MDISCKQFKSTDAVDIMKFLADKNSSTLYPKDAQRRPVIDEWIDFIDFHVANAVARLKKDAMGARFLKQFLLIIEKQLKNNRYLVGQQMSLADILLMAVLDKAESSSVDLSAYPSITHWRKDLQQNAGLAVAQ